jgi:Na+-driven multidrug efflux pump
MRLLVPGAVFYLLGSLFIRFVGSQGRPEWSGLVLLLGAASNAGLSILLIPRWGINGAAVASLAGNLVALAALLVIVQKVFGVRLLQCVGLRRADIRSVLQKGLKRT